MNCLVFNIKDFKFGIPIENIERIIEVKGRVFNLPLVPDFVAGITNYQGRIITVIDFGAFFKTDSKSTELIVISNKMKHIGYAVLNTEGFINIDDERLEDVDKFSIDKEKKEYIRFITEIEGGKVISILDIDKIEDYLKNPKNWSHYYEV
jgi:chemotaxis signal transduction protein